MLQARLQQVPGVPRGRDRRGAMLRAPLLCIAAVLLQVSVAVDKGKFRTCEQGSFCRRFKKWTVRPDLEEALWHIVEGSRADAGAGEFVGVVLNAGSGARKRSRSNKMPRERTPMSSGQGFISKKVLEDPPAGVVDIETVTYADVVQAIATPFQPCNDKDFSITNLAKCHDMALEYAALLQSNLRLSGILELEQRPGTKFLPRGDVDPYP